MGTVDVPALEWVLLCLGFRDEEVAGCCYWCYWCFV